MGKNSRRTNEQPTTARNQSLYAPTLGKLILALVSILLLAFSLRGSSRSQPSAPTAPSLAVSHQVNDATNPEPEDHECPLPTTRYNLYTGKAACYPSSGGIWMAELGSLELLHLGVNRFQNTPRSPVQTDEDAFCIQLRQFGGDWYNPASGEDLRVAGSCHELAEFEPVFSISRRVGFARDGGMWILKPDEETGKFPDGIITVQNALTMGERCSALENLGAVYCDRVDNCNLLRDLEKQPSDHAKDFSGLGRNKRSYR